MTKLIGRRGVLGGSALLGGALATPRFVFGQGAPAVMPADSMRPKITHGVMTGDVTADRAVLWSRADRTARMIVEYDTSDAFTHPVRVMGPHATEATDFTTRVDLTGLPAGQDVFYRVTYVDAMDLQTLSEPVQGRFRTAPAGLSPIRFVWSGDTAGQGWGINLEWGGMKIYETMRQQNPHFFIHCGDTIYADGPIQAEVELADGTIWKNVTTEEKSKVAETLKEFRGNYQYNLLDANVRAFNAEVGQIWQWDDHEVVNNWSPSKDLSADDRYTVKNVGLLVARATRAFHEYAPLRFTLEERERVYRHIPYGPLLDVFVIDMRTYRGPNTGNHQEEAGPETAFLGREQIEWLKQGLLNSKATWKVIASDMPIGLQVADGSTRFENMANGDGPALGREMEMAGLLRFIKASGIKNIVWVTADTHYTGAHYYDPSKAVFTDFDPFWEFMSGPLNAGTFGPNKPDNTFGFTQVYAKHPEDGKANLPPSDGLQFFGQVDIDPATRVMTVQLKDIAGATLFTQVLEPQSV